MCFLMCVRLRVRVERESPDISTMKYLHLPYYLTRELLQDIEARMFYYLSVTPTAKIKTTTIIACT